MVAAKVKLLSITFGGESGCFVHSHSADGVFGHGFRFFHGHVPFFVVVTTFRRHLSFDMIVFFFNCKTQDKADRPGDHPFLVRMNDADRDPAGIRGNHALTGRVSLFFEFDSKESQPIANPVRTVGAFSPMPPANTSVSSPPNAAANAPIHFLTW